eukprot:6209664-Pleurochrysis_carterae.AAC.2
MKGGGRRWLLLQRRWRRVEKLSRRGSDFAIKVDLSPFSAGFSGGLAKASPFACLPSRLPLFPFSPLSALPWALRSFALRLPTRLASWLYSWLAAFLSTSLHSSSYTELCSQGEVCTSATALGCAP